MVLSTVAVCVYAALLILAVVRIAMSSVTLKYFTFIDVTVISTSKQSEATTIATVPSSLCPHPNHTITNSTTFMSDHDILHVVQDYYFHEADRKPIFSLLGRRLLEQATTQDQYLLSLQIGGMDGKSNDPMYNMFVRENDKGLHHWLPIVVEPVSHNFHKLSGLYEDEYRDQHGVGCYGLQQWAISYSPNSHEEGCVFCQFDVSDDAPQVCKDHPDWMKYQIGTLDCEYSKAFFAGNFETCIKQDAIPCGTVAQLLEQYQLVLETTPIGILQVDVEGYESTLIPALLEEMTNPPPVIHFENKVMLEQDKETNTTQLPKVLSALLAHGYGVVEDQRTGDTLALRIDPNERLYLSTNVSVDKQV